MNDDPQLEQEASTILNTEKRLGCVNQSEKAPVIQRLMSYETFYASNKTLFFLKRVNVVCIMELIMMIIDPILRDFETHNDIIKLDDLDTLERCILAVDRRTPRYKLERRYAMIY